MTQETPGFSSAPNVIGLHSGGKVNDLCVAELRKMLEMAEAGQIVGIVCVSLHGDMTASQTIAGIVGGSGMMGQFRIAEHDLLHINLNARGK